MKKNNVYTGFLLLMFISMGAGCATTHKTTTTEKTTVQYPNKEDSRLEEGSAPTKGISDQPTEPIVEKSTTTTTTTDTKPEQTGLLGGVFHVIGSVIALPFIFIGGLLRMIF